jgi:hypothetical protein
MNPDPDRLSSGLVPARIDPRLEAAGAESRPCCLLGSTPAVAIRIPAARVLGPGIPDALPMLRRASGRTGGRLRFSFRSASSPAGSKVLKGEMKCPKPFRREKCPSPARP